MSKPLILSLEGNIGAGKSTLLNELQMYYANNNEIVFMREPVELWENIQDKEGNNMLAKFYSDPVKYSFSFQIMAYTTRLHMLKKTLRENPSCKILICERSLEADKHIFAKMLHDDGLIEDVNYQIYQAYFSEYEEMFQLNGLVYVRAEPDICYQRVCKRNRNGEGSIQLDYLQKCHHYHEKWLENADIHILLLDVNKNVCLEESNMDKGMYAWIKQVEAFIKKLQYNNSCFALTNV
jgi:deoxyadenosine/deoxycytidine kinase